MRRLARLLGLIAILAAPMSAVADPAQDAIAAAQGFVAAGDFVNAAAKYREAYAADPRPELICNVGVAYVKAKDLSRAQLYLSRCLERGTFDAKFTTDVHAAMTAVDSQLRAGDFTPIDIQVQPAGAAISISGFAKDEGFVGGRVVWLPFGTHVIHASLEGYTDGSVEVTAATHATTAATIALVRTPGAVVVPQPPHPPPPRPHVVSRPPASPVPAIVATGVTVGAVVVAGFALHFSRAHADLGQFALTPTAFAADRSSVDHYNSMMALASATAIVGAGLSGFLWYRAFHTESHVELDAGREHAQLMFSRAW